MSVIAPKSRGLFARIWREVRRVPLIPAKLYRCYILKDKDLIELRRWRRAQGDQTLRLSYPLEIDSVVFDLGGYRGEFAANMHKRYGCTVCLFEPIPRLYSVCAERFAGNSRIRCFDFGLSDRNAALFVDDKDNSTSLVSSAAGADGVAVTLRKMSAFLTEHQVDQIDLIKINIEGGEYDLLTHMVAEGLVARCGLIQIQFHRVVDDAEARREAIRNALRATHTEQWNFPFVWESWALR